MNAPMIFIAHNLRSKHNVGSIFRSADAFGIEKIYLTGYTPAPPDRDISKTALGSEHRVPWETCGLPKAISECHAYGFRVYGLELGYDALAIKDASEGSIALVLGNEVTGIEPDALAQLDGCLEIPLRGSKRSLNVSVAAGIAMFVLSSRS